MQIKDIMCDDVVSVSPDASVKEAAKKMRDGNCGTVAVIEDGRLVGMLNDRQIAVNVVAGGRNPSRVQVGEVMSKRLVTSTPEMDIIDAAKIMGKHHFRRLPVVDREHHLRGIVSICDLSRPLKEYTDSVLDELIRERPTRPARFGESQTMPQWMFA
ncbi:MAG TPA: CBS domain-containing protein [Euryarchaeota archaeon]|nr:hypoxic response protein 1 [archaeon BMS3Abin16]GBE56895.1 hypoxic response protein 1 [archaeon BMS3Bbin16]HDH28200.1 CBS domain-containing protein [Euryarchaeota archaeon]